jgi:hypothetical protein
MDVRGFRMVRLITEGAPLTFLRRSGIAIGFGIGIFGGAATLPATAITTNRRRRPGRSTNWSRTTRGNMSVANATITATLLLRLSTRLSLLTALLLASSLRKSRKRY